MGALPDDFLWNFQLFSTKIATRRVLRPPEKPISILKLWGWYFLETSRQWFFMRDFKRFWKWTVEISRGSKKLRQNSGKSRRLARAISRWRSITSRGGILSSASYVGRRGKPSTWLPRQKLAEERILERGKVSWVFPNGPGHLLIKFKVFNFFRFFDPLTPQIPKPLRRGLPHLFSSYRAETLSKF